ncbi:hypothetical protein HDU80_002170 [Chytriomyces hyalinus]|nr:hypothetical protein HDU80_002170 [Chytriomyces hyalinus]
MQAAEHSIPEYSILWDMDPSDHPPPHIGSKRKQPVVEGLCTSTKKRELTEKKAMQNRIAQKAFRERKEAQFRSLEAKAVHLEQLLAARTNSSTTQLEPKQKPQPAAHSTFTICFHCKHAHKSSDPTSHPILTRMKLLQDQIEELELENALLKAEPAAPVSNERLRIEMQFLADQGLLDQATLQTLSGTLNSAGFGIGGGYSYDMGQFVPADMGIRAMHMHPSMGLSMNIGVHTMMPTNEMHPMMTAAVCVDHGYSLAEFGLPLDATKGT